MSPLARALCLCLLGAGAAAAQSMESNALLDERAARGRGGGAGGAATAVLAEIARELISRSTSSSQVLSLNLTNLVILLVLKAIIFGAGSMGLGWPGKGAREAGGDPSPGPGGLVSEQEALLVLGFLMGDERDGYRCLNRVACQDPDAANSYARAGLLLTKGARMMSGLIPYDEKFESIADGLAEAVEFGRTGNSCAERYSCSR